jgi:ribosomal protein S18 acetylase RimI-like enzyme
MAEVTIRTATTRDVDSVLALWSVAGGTATVTDTPDGVKRLLETAPEALLVAEARVVVGTLIAAWDGWRGSLYRLAVHPGRRRQRIGTLLLREGERRLRALGAVRLTAILVDDDPAVAAFWSAAGYERQANRARFIRHLPDHADGTLAEQWPAAHTSGGG